MTNFDKLCATLAIPIGVIFMVLGIVGLFAGSSANFRLPPVLGVLPFFLGWAMSITLIRCWRRSPPSSAGDAQPDGRTDAAPGGASSIR